MPATNELANVYQLYMVLYQCASILMSHSQGMDDITVNAKTIINKAAHTVFFQIYFFPSSIVFNGFSSRLLERLLIFHPSKDHATIVNTVQKTKNPLLRKLDLASNIASCFTCSASVQ